MKDKVVEVFKKVFENNDITFESTREELENWDSMNHLMLIFEVESRFEVNFEPDEMNNITSVKSMYLIIEKKLNS
jgi:acyl carrier protein